MVKHETVDLGDVGSYPISVANKGEDVVDVYTVTKEQLEENYDIIKVSVLGALVAEKFLTEKEADEWAKTHSVALRKKPFFRTLTSLWSNEKTVEDKYYNIIVKKVE